MLDAHCHLDRYPDPKATASEAATRGVFIIAVTQLPSHFRIGLPHVQGLSKVRLALGLHPLAVVEHARERELFRKSLYLTSYIGEVGLDFSPHGIKTRDAQVDSFRFVAECLASERKIVSVHSRGAEAAVLDILAEFEVREVILHWYSGSINVLEQAVAQGHLFSVNPAMIQSKKGQRILERIPPDRLLTETDGPYVQIGRDPASPWDVAAVEDHVARMWAVEREEVRSKIWSNFQRIAHSVQSVGNPSQGS